MFASFPFAPLADVIQVNSISKLPGVHKVIISSKYGCMFFAQIPFILFLFNTLKIRSFLAVIFAQTPIIPCIRFAHIPLIPCIFVLKFHSFLAFVFRSNSTHFGQKNARALIGFCKAVRSNSANFLHFSHSILEPGIESGKRYSLLKKQKQH